VHALREMTETSSLLILQIRGNQESQHATGSPMRRYHHNVTKSMYSTCKMIEATRKYTGVYYVDVNTFSEQPHASSQPGRSACPQPSSWRG
jgi:hypothetical protein